MQLKSLLSKTNLVIRSILFEISIPIMAMFYCFPCLIAWPFLSLRYRYQIIVYWTIAATWLLKVLCHIDYKMEGLENIPKDRNGIIMCKHQSTFETFILPRFFEQTAIIAKQEIILIPFFGWAFATTDPIFINRKKTSSAMEQIIKKGKKALDAGRWILIFPEGTRTPYGKTSKYRLGGARLAAETNYPIIPIAHDAGYYWPRQALIKKPGTIRMVIGPLIETQGRDAEEILKDTKNWIEETMEKLHVHHR